MCRTNAMKGRVYSCPNGHFSIFIRESCNNRSCPTCQSEIKENGILIQKKKFLILHIIILFLSYLLFCIHIFFPIIKNL
nr:transposase zinc-binding domain-containing protein [Leptospira vanthielii]